MTEVLTDPNVDQSRTREAAKTLDMSAIVGNLAVSAVDTFVPSQEQFTQRAHDAAKYSVTDVDDIKRHYFGLPNDLIEGAVHDAEAVRPLMRVAHRMSAEGFGRFLQTGRLMSYKETGYSAGKAGVVKKGDPYDFERVKYEKKHDLHRDGEPELIHGFIEDTSTIGERQIAFPYGQIEVILKPEVMDRAVYTFGDSALTQAAPMDKELALISEQVRNRKHQRIDHMGGISEGYMEAIIMGGVGLEDVEAVAINIESKGLSDTLTEAEDYILTMQEHAPDTALTICIAADALFPTKGVLELAQKYPHVKFMGIIASESPFQALGSEERDQRIGESAAEQVDTRAGWEYDTSKERKEHLEARLRERWVAAGNEGLPPKNISFHLRLGYY